MMVRDKHRYVEMSGAEDWAAQARGSTLYELAEEAFDRYDNPFEQKWALREKWNQPRDISNMFRYLESLVGMASEIFDVKLKVEENRHYAGLFKYVDGDKLDVHVDAGIYPLDQSLRKHVTVLLYLTDSTSPLEFWAGKSCTVESPELYLWRTEILARQGKVVLFENNDYAWHGVPVYCGEEPRMVATVSFLSECLSHFQNRRERAFFIPRPDEHWSPETYALRDQRAHSTQHKGVYRTGVTA